MTPITDTLRKVVADDQSYYGVAAAMRSLHKVDRDNCAKDLLTATARGSYEEVILKTNSILRLAFRRFSLRYFSVPTGNPTGLYRGYFGLQLANAGFIP